MPMSRGKKAPQVLGGLLAAGVLAAAGAEAGIAAACPEHDGPDSTGTSAGTSAGNAAEKGGANANSAGPADSAKPATKANQVGGASSAVKGPPSKSTRTGGSATGPRSAADTGNDPSATVCAEDGSPPGSMPCV